MAQLRARAGKHTDNIIGFVTRQRSSQEGTGVYSAATRKTTADEHQHWIPIPYPPWPLPGGGERRVSFSPEVFAPDENTVFRGLC